jgi:vacuolar-type H+-ATPase subunit F/Vma7
MSDFDGVPIVALGERHLVEGFVLGGARVVPAENPRDVRSGWEALPEEAVVILTTKAASVVEDLERGARPSRRMRVVMPQ